MKIENNVYAYYTVNKETGKVTFGPFASRKEAREFKLPRVEQIVRMSPQKVVR